MKFVPETYDGVNVISRHDGARVWVGATAYEGALIVPWRGDVRAWEPRSFAELAALHFEAVAAYEPELVLFGSGARMRFAAPAALRGLITRRVGVECMDTAAACRTFNVLASEGRKVVAALLQDPA